MKSLKTHRTHRREFIKHAAATSFGVWIGTGTAAAAASQSPNEKLNIGKIGAGGKGGGDTHGVKTENIVALCDVDLKRAAPTIRAFPQAKVYRDYRAMLDKEKLDAVVVSTPDHMHAPSSLAAMRLGLHVYCQKPLTHTVAEARLMRDVAREQGVATQMGNQGTSNDTMRRAVELVHSGAIGIVREAHVWTDRPIWPQGGARPATPMAPPYHLAWDLWLGCAAERPYHEAYCPFAWRGWWDFGQGALGDMGCHNLNLPYWAMKLECPTAVEATVNGLTDEMAPSSATIRYEFPARGNLPPAVVYWYDGDNKPPRELLDGLPEEKKVPNNGVLLVGREGKLYAPSSHCRLYQLWPKEKYEGYEGPAPTLARSPGHYLEWINACKGGPPAMSNFDYASRLTETVLLGNVAIRAGHRIEWDAEAMRVSNCRAANLFVSKQYRDGWGM